MPSYTGHVPTLNLDYAETYGNHSAKYFQDFRSKTLESSRTNMSRGGYFPSFWSHGPWQAVEARTRKWDRWLEVPHYRLLNEDHDRRQELINFCKLSQAHREHYCDDTETVPKVEHFQIPAPTDDEFKKNVPFSRLAMRYTDDISIPYWDHQPQFERNLKHKSLHVSTAADRAIRDLYFETRRVYGL